MDEDIHFELLPVEPSHFRSGIAVLTVERGERSLQWLFRAYRWEETHFHQSKKRALVRNGVDGGFQQP